MRWIDVGILVIVIGSGVFGLTRGLIVQVGGIIGAVGGLYLALHEYGTTRRFLALFFHADGHLSAAAFILVLAVVWMLVVIIAHGLRSVLRFTPLGALDYLGGALIGLVLGVLAVEILLMLASESHDASLRASIHASRLAPIFDHAIPGLHSLVPKKLPLL
jgi:uncharacterized membrane protein required for colicin V production